MSLAEQLAWLMDVYGQLPHGGGVEMVIGLLLVLQGSQGKRQAPASGILNRRSIKTHPLESPFQLLKRRRLSSPAKGPCGSRSCLDNSGLFSHGMAYLQAVLKLRPLLRR